MLQLILSAVDDPLADAWERFCGHFDFVQIQRGSILDLSVDAVVSPANSFGFMDGGVDHLYSRFFGWHVQERLQRAIRERHNGELLVGEAEVVETGHPRITFVVAAPTMRVPMVLRDTVNPYLAARAALLLVQRAAIPDGVLAGEAAARVIQTLAFPGLGTGVGQVSPNTCARQMQAAIEDVLVNPSPFPSTWAEAQARHQLLYTDRVRDLQRG